MNVKRKNSGQPMIRTLKSFLVISFIAALTAAWLPVVVEAASSHPEPVRLVQSGGSDKDGIVTATSVYEKKELDNPLGTARTIPEVVARVIQVFTGLVGSLALLMFVYGGLLMMTSRGDSAAVQKGKTVMVQATIGLVVIFTAYGLVYLIFNALGVRSI